ncbi:MAG TPA: hypothetical protein VN703_08305 [Candidatus Sulfopaludibacter sp.]|jgi:hypothetical protein|nr:hypothetical protein [Candidatus Sulfopaludibacter sp.]
MRYNEAAFIGQKNSKDAQIKLFNYTGFAMLTYTIKQSPDGKGFLPVGEKTFAAKSPVYDNQIILYLTDEEGFAKAQSKPLKIEEAEKLFDKMLQDGIENYKGPIKTI